MKKLAWLAPPALTILGVTFYQNIPTNFLGLVCFCLAALTLVYLLLGVLGRKKAALAKGLTTWVSVLVCLGLMLVTCTGILVWDASRGQPEEACQYILVLGAKVNGEQPSKILAQRIEAAYDYLQKNPQTVAVLSGGQGADEGISEAQCMYNSLTAMGIGPERLIKEDRATSTWENLEFSLALLPQGTEKIGIVTSEFHLYRAATFAGQYGLQSVGIPAKTENHLHYVNYFLREIAGVWHYIILGG